MTKSKWNLWVKVRSALRDIYRYSPMRREAIKLLALPGGKEFVCAECGIVYPIQLADVDHEPPCGALTCGDELLPFFNQLMYGKVQLLCKHICHKAKTASQRRKK